ncbi:MAG TPA: polyprenyl synthetase family protein [Patescibacteria group bacterium]|nr:polyprenyl synthetase family protein [Patescibacteria group bacterium]
MSLDFHQDLKGIQKDIDIALANYLSALAPPVNTGQAIKALELLKEFSSRSGKRLRGAMAIIAYQMFGGKNHKSALKLAVAIELIQNYLLIVDDVMDHSKSRRRLPTIHEQYLGLIKSSLPIEKTVHLSNMLGINVGLIAQHMASEYLATIDDDPNRLLKTHKLFHANILNTCYGQIEDLFNNSYRQVGEEEIIQTYILKSSYYSFINPLQLGATLAGASAKDIEILKQFGVHAGLAFQLQDDLIGMFGDQEKSGKSNTDDLKEGKMTLLIHHGLAHSSPQEFKKIHEALGNDKLTLKQYADVQNILEKAGSREFVQQRAKEESRLALECIEPLKSRREGYDFLNSLLTYIIKRDK